MEVGGIPRVPRQYIVKSNEMDSLQKLFFSNPNGLFTCYSMYSQKQSIQSYE